MRPADGVAVLAVAVLLAAAAAAAAPRAPAPALTLERTLPLTGVRLERLQAIDRTRLSSKKGVVEYSMEGMPGLYYTRVNLGTPSNEYILQFDTGSDLLWVSCTPCTGCPISLDPNITLKSYNPNSSSTSSIISCSDDRCENAMATGYAGCNISGSPSSKCGYMQTYADGSETSGFYVSDALYFQKVLGNETVTNPSASIFFGCSMSRLDLMKTDGIIGFGKNAVSVISQLYSLGVSPRVFSHCLKGSNNGGGILLLGEVTDPGFVYTPLLPSQPHYNVNLKSIAVNGKNIPIDSSLWTAQNARGTIIDSGTTLSYFADGIYDQIVNAINDAIPDNIRYYEEVDRTCYISSIRNFSQFPDVTLYFEGGAPLTMRPVDYLLLQGFSTDFVEDILCVGFQNSKWLQGLEHTTILGDLVLHDKIFVYNVEKMQIGWISYNCSLLNTSSVLVSSESPGRRATLFYSISIAIGVGVINILIRSNLP